MLADNWPFRWYQNVGSRFFHLLADKFFTAKTALALIQAVKTSRRDKRGNILHETGCKRRVILADLNNRFP